jgi:hypothetical protein
VRRTLAGQAADGAQHAELAPAVGNRHGQRVDDAENRDQHGDRDLHRGQREPLIGHADDVSAELAVGENEHLPLVFVALENPPLHVRHLRASAR